DHRIEAGQARHRREHIFELETSLRVLVSDVLNHHCGGAPRRACVTASELGEPDKGAVHEHNIFATITTTAFQSRAIPDCRRRTDRTGFHRELRDYLLACWNFGVCSAGAAGDVIAGFRARDCGDYALSQGDNRLTFKRR